MKVKTILPDNVKELLTEDSLSAIDTALQEKTRLMVEAALISQDELYSSKLQELINAIDNDHGKKLQQVIEAVDKKNAKQLLNVIKKYEKVVNKDAKDFKNTLVESISDYIEEYIDEALPKDAILEATKNRTAREVLNNLRSVLAVDSALMKESVKEAVKDGKTQLDDLTARLDKAEKENKLLRESYQTTKAQLLLETKTADLHNNKKTYLKKLLSDKTPAFIEENFAYTLRLVEKKEKEKI